MNRRKALAILASSPAAAADFASSLPAGERIWLGPEYWANPLQDWRLRAGRIECATAGGDRNVYLLTHEISQERRPFRMEVRLGVLEPGTALGDGFAGFRFGIRGNFGDYRDSAIYGLGVNAGILPNGSLFIGDPAAPGPEPIRGLDQITLTLSATPAAKGYEVELTAASGSSTASVRRSVPFDWVPGGLALVSSSGPVPNTPDPKQQTVSLSGINRRGVERGGTFRFWFQDWKVSGPAVLRYSERAWGPILFTMHTASRGVVKMTAQLAPVSPGRDPVVLELQQGGRWRRAGSSSIDPLSRTAHFRVEQWRDRADTPYRVRYQLDGKDHVYEGVIRRDPQDKPQIVVAGISCIGDLGHPHAEATRSISTFKPDLVAFMGDQIYERNAGYGIERLPLERAALDYLRKWYVFGWGMKELMRSTPSICMPDDHDVFHGNIWGSAGRRAEGMGQPGQDSGGYTQPAEWVNMVQRTQTSHLPDPFDPTPVEQGISVYYTSLNVGGVDFAIIEDRKWKSAPKFAVPEAKIVNGWSQNRAYDAARHGDVPGASLLGDRQHRFLEHWSADWSRGIWMKVAISQTIFCNLATLPRPANTDSVTPKLPILKVGEYPEDELRVQDHDSNGWPQTPRNNALRLLRRAFAFHMAGDQHLGSTIRYGVDDWRDAACAVCVPALSNIFPRRWYPQERGGNAQPGAPRNTGDYVDGFGNKVTVHAVFNPQQYEAEPRVLSHRAAGYGIITFDREQRTITVANWPRWVDASQPGAKPAPGWSIVFRQTENAYANSALALDVASFAKPGTVVQVVDEKSKAALYTLRVGRESRLPVPHQGPFTLRIIDAKGNRASERTGLIAARQ